MTELDAAARRMVTGALYPPFLYAIGPDDARRALALMQVPPAEPAGAGHHVLSVATARGPMRVHVLVPHDAGTRAPVVLYAHGGGWVIGGYDTHHRLAAALCRETGAIVVVPEYTRVPEARHPAAVEQLTAALGWIRSGALPVGADLSRVAVAGDCAGATMVAAVAMADRDTGAPPLAAMVLLYPLGRPGPRDGSAAEFATGAGLRLEDVRRLWRGYSPSADPLADPLAARRPAGLPATLLVTAEADVNRDPAERFGARLRAAGVPVTAVRYLGTVHDFAVLDALRWTPAARAVVGQAVDHLSAAFRIGTP
ncbi:alpha/beta hydrolase fold domain-containing protein [Actinoplanes sp. NPDC051494]|uniref:alpha/beta hydrolase fold domain-containing protein n=1 Tax=Actinoplanes sp. NPDC051494 TaxID=3363907 RepID=UPI0037BBEA9E